MMKYMYLIAESEWDAYPVGNVMIQDQKMQNHDALGGGPGTKFTASIYNMDEDERMKPSFIYLGKHEFEDEQDYEERVMDVIKPLVEEYGSKDMED